jgi:hypothetical protein
MYIQYELFLKNPMKMPKENASEFLSMKGAVAVDGIANIGLHLKNERLILIPVIEGGDFQTYDIIHVEKNGNFSSSWPIKSLKSLKGMTSLPISSSSRADLRYRHRRHTEGREPCPRPGWR